MDIAQDFDAFIGIVDAGSISGGARALDVPRATLSRQLARLEKRLGVRLLHRSTRKLTLTPAGEELYPRARALLSTAQAAVRAVQRLDDVPRGLLRVSCAPLESPILGHLLADYVDRYPEVKVELISSTRHRDLAAEKIDVALRSGIVRDPNLVARPLMRTELVAVGSAEYLATHGVPATTADLAQYACLCGFRSGLRPSPRWPLKDGGRVEVAGPLVTNDLMALLGATLSGLGIALLPRSLVQAEITRGELVPVLEDTVGQVVSISLVWLEREFLDPKVRAFIDLVSTWVKEGRFELGTASNQQVQAPRDAP